MRRRKIKSTTDPRAIRSYLTKYFNPESLNRNRGFGGRYSHVFCRFSSSCAFAIQLACFYWCCYFFFFSLRSDSYFPDLDRPIVNILASCRKLHFGPKLSEKRYVARRLEKETRHRIHYDCAWKKKKKKKTPATDVNPM